MSDTDLRSREVLQITDEVGESQQPQLQHTPMSGELNDNLMIMGCTRCPLSHQMCAEGMFLKARSRFPNQAPCFLLEGEEGFTTYTPESNKWIILTNTFIRGRIPSQEQKQVLQASCSGILLLQDVYGVSDLTQPSSLHLYNPVSKSRKLLPPMLRSKDNFCPRRIFSVHEDYKGCYKILALRNRWFFCHDQIYSPCFQIYDNTSDKWEICKSNFVGLSGETFFVQTLVIIGILIYALVRIGEPEILPKHIPQLYQLFLLGEYGWHVLPLRMPHRMIDAHLFEHGGKLMIIAVCRSPNNFTKEFSICIWELQASNTNTI